MSNDKKISFILCGNNDIYIKECLKYIENLEVPSGFEIEALVVDGAKSMTSGYNEAMNASDSKYKIYIHQDVFIKNKNMIYELLECFTDESIGMVGVIGNIKLPDSAIMWDAERVGMVDVCNIDKKYILESQNGQSMTDVEAIDGLFMATQYDLPWREDLFTGWDFYDISQSQEFLRAGYRVVVPKFKESWCLHNDSFNYNKLMPYNHSRRIFQREYCGYTGPV